MNGIDISDIRRMEKTIAAAGRITVLVHIRPDGDAAGSGTAMLIFLKSIGKDAVIVLPHSCPESLLFLMTDEVRACTLVHEDSPQAAEDRIKESDLLICQDFNDFSRAGDIGPVLEKSDAAKILIDHHLNPSSEKFDFVFSSTETSSTSEILFHILLSMSEIQGDAGRLPKDAATALMTGMLTDTNNFANSTYPSTLEMASALLKAGVDRDMILEKVFKDFREERLRVLGKLLTDMTITADGVAYMILDRGTIIKYGIQDGDTEGFVNLPLTISRVKMSIFMKEDEDRFRVSIRSKKGTSANACARRYFNGGGHELASGGKMLIPAEIKDAEDAARYIEKVTHRFFTETEDE